MRRFVQARGDVRVLQCTEDGCAILRKLHAAARALCENLSLFIEEAENLCVFRGWTAREECAKTRRLHLCCCHSLFGDGEDLSRCRACGGHLLVEHLAKLAVEDRGGFSGVLVEDVRAGRIEGPAVADGRLNIFWVEHNKLSKPCIE